MVSGVMGVAYTMAIVVGTLLAESLSILTAYVASAVLVVALVLPFLVGHRATTVLPTPPPQRTTIDAEANRPRRFSEYKDFTWVFISRLSATLGNTVALFYLLYYLRDYIGLDDPDGGPSWDRGRRLLLLHLSRPTWAHRRVETIELVSEATVSQRILRAKRKIADAAIPYRVPPPGARADRLNGVLAVIAICPGRMHAITAPEPSSISKSWPPCKTVLTVDTS